MLKPLVLLSLLKIYDLFDLIAVIKTKPEKLSLRNLYSYEEI